MKLKATVDCEYFIWLTNQITIPERNRNTYRDLFKRLHETEFVWIVLGDDNRIQDARDLRIQFKRTYKAEQRPVSVLEVLIALSRRTAFTAGGSPEEWAWHLLENLNLHKASDPIRGVKATRLEETIEALIWRTYEFDGHGGFFPLRNPPEDQTKVEIWFQMNAYVIEIHEP